MDYKNWIDKFGQEFAEDLLEANNEKPSIYIRTNTLKISREELIEKLSEMGIVCLKVPMVEEAIKVEKNEKYRKNELFKAGLFTIQDISSMIVGKVINPKEGSFVLMYVVLLEEIYSLSYFNEQYWSSSS